MSKSLLLSWILAVGLAIAFALMMGLPKLIGPSPNPIFAIIAGRSGIALFEPLIRMTTGVVEIIAALLLVLPKTRRYGAMLALAITAGAIGFHLSPWLGIELPNIPQLLAHLRDGKSIQEVDALNLATDGGTLFAMAVTFFTIAGAILWLEKATALKSRSQ